jgi:hypothetical protein
MIARVLILSLSLSFAAAPTLAIGGGPPVGGARTSASFDTAASDGSLNAAAVSAPPASISRHCEEQLRSFMGRNTMRPSERREAIERCHDQPAAIDRSEIESP